MHTCIYISYIHTRHSPLSQCLPPFSLARGHLGAYETRCHWGNTSSRRRWSSWHQFQIAVRQQQFILHKDTREASADYTRTSVHHAEMDIILPLEHVNSAPLIENEIYLIRMLGPSLGRGPCPGWRPCLCSRCPRASQIAFSLNQFSNYYVRVEPTTSITYYCDHRRKYGSVWWHEPPAHNRNRLQITSEVELVIQFNNNSSYWFCSFVKGCGV